MTLKYLDSKRISGTTADREGIPAVSGGWKELARTTLGSAGDIISVASLADKRYYMVLNSVIPSGSVSPRRRLNNDSGSNYSARTSGNGSSDATNTSISYFNTYTNYSNPYFQIDNIVNISNKEKLNISQLVDQNSAGAGTAPQREEGVNKWANTSASINRYDSVNTEGGDYAIGSEVVVLGWDDSDTHTTNFWEELASVTQSGAGSSLDSGTITAKKYLWIQTFNPDKPSGNNLYYRFNSDTASNYANRYSTNGGADVTQLSVGNGVGCNYDPSASGTTAGLFMNTFIINNSANEKLCTTNTISGWTNAGAGVAPARFQVSSKWANTSAQITSVQYNGGASSVSDGTIMKVWGSD